MKQAVATIQIEQKVVTLSVVNTFNSMRVLVFSEKIESNTPWLNEKYHVIENKRIILIGVIEKLKKQYESKFHKELPSYVIVFPDNVTQTQEKDYVYDLTHNGAYSSGQFNQKIKYQIRDEVKKKINVAGQSSKNIKTVLKIKETTIEVDGLIIYSHSNQSIKGKKVKIDYDVILIDGKMFNDHQTVIRKAGIKESPLVATTVNYALFYTTPGHLNTSKNQAVMHWKDDSIELVVYNNKVIVKLWEIKNSGFNRIVEQIAIDLKIEQNIAYDYLTRNFVFNSPNTRNIVLFANANGSRLTGAQINNIVHKAITTEYLKIKNSVKHDAGNLDETPIYHFGRIIDIPGVESILNNYRSLGNAMIIDQLQIGTLHKTIQAMIAFGTSVYVSKRLLQAGNKQIKVKTENHTHGLTFQSNPNINYNQPRLYFGKSIIIDKVKPKTSKIK